MERLKQAGIRAEEDSRNEKIGFKIREARNRKIPYMVIIGDKETEMGNISVRKRGENTTSVFSIEEFLSLIEQEVASRS
ncbi:His/Gly/Thr/Pro-type tRNA ligase C-terminal domain-containing protein [Thermodesulfobacteriota bacterium]